MHIVVKGTKTVQEFKEKQKMMSDLAVMCFRTHKNCVGQWNNGEPVKVWFDQYENLCIEYSSGSYFHYRFNVNQQIEWW